MIICPNCNHHDQIKVNILGYDQCIKCGYVFPEKRITIEDCRNLYNKFMVYTETAEQYEFPILAQIQLMMEASLKKWENEVDQKEAAAMFRVVKKCTGVSL